MDNVNEQLIFIKYIDYEVEILIIFLVKKHLYFLRTETGLSHNLDSRKSPG